MQHYILGTVRRTKDFDFQYFKSILCIGGHGHTSHYEAGEKYCAKDQVFLKVSKEILRCPKCGKQLRNNNAASTPRARRVRYKDVVRY